jgi:hypothetical protein
VSDIDVYTSAEDDRDGDGKYSQFRVGVTADTNVGGFGDISDPFFRIYVNGRLIRTVDVASDANFYREFELSRAELADLESGTPRITVELLDDDAFGNTLEYKSDHTPAIEFEPSGQDYSAKKRALIGMNSITGSYADANEYLNVDTLQSDQINYVENAFEALLPLSRDDIEQEAAITLLEQISSAAANAIDTILTTPTVLDNVDKSLDAGKQANALQNTDRTTRSEFHRHLNDLASQDVSTDPAQMSDAELRDRKETLEDAYESTKAYRASVRKTWDTGALREYAPDWMVDLYGADRATLKKLQAHFTQLEELLIADYYYTQQALNPDSNVQPQNLTTVTTWREPSYPTANIVEYDTPDTVNVGETATASVTVKTENNDTPSQTITIGLPDDDSVKNVRIAENSIENPSYSKVYPAGSDLWTGYGDSEEQIPYTVVETAGPMSAGSTHTIEIRFEPTSPGSVRLWAKSVAWTDSDASGGLSPYPRREPQSRDNVVTDGQDELAEQRSIDIVDPDPAEFEIADVDTNTPVQTGADLTATATVENTGDVTGSADIEFAVPSVGRDVRSVQLEGGGTSTVEFSVPTDRMDAGTYTATVSSPDSEMASQVTISRTNRSPTADDLQLSTEEDESISATFEASDPDGDPLSYTVRDRPRNGDVAVNGASFTYTPDTGYSGTDEFTYEVTDGNGGSDTATVTLDISSVNTPPRANDRSVTTTADTPVSGSFDASDPDDDQLSYAVTATPAHGRVSTSGDEFTYTPDTGYSGTDEFTYEVTDGNGGRDTATVSIAIDTANAEPVAEFSWSPAEPTTETAVRFDATSSSDPDGTIDEYQWDFDADGTPDVTGKTVTHTFDSAAEHPVELTVIDDAGATDTTEEAVSVVPADPAGGSLTVNVATPTGESLSDIDVALYESKAYPAGSPITVSQTDADGAVSFSEVPVGASQDQSAEYTVEATAPEYEQTTISTSLYEPTQTTDRLSLTLRPNDPVDEIELGAQSGLTYNDGVGYLVTPDGVLKKFDVDTYETIDSFDVPGGDTVGLAYGEDSLWYADGVDSDFDGEIIELDPNTGEVRSRIDTSYDPRGLAFSDGSLWAVDITGNNVIEYTPDGEQRSQFSVPTTTPQGLASADGSLWLGDYCYGDSDCTATIYEFRTDGTLAQETNTQQHDDNGGYGSLAATDDGLLGPGADSTLEILRPLESDQPETLDVSLSPSSVTVDQPTNLTVTVTDGSEEPIEGVTVTSDELDATATTTTDGNATLSITPAAVGEYSISASTERLSETATLTVTSGGDDDHESGVSQALFDAVDNNGDGALDRQELRAAVAEFIRSGEVTDITIKRTDVRALVEYFIRS